MEEGEGQHFFYRRTMWDGEVKTRRVRSGGGTDGRSLRKSRGRMVKGIVRCRRLFTDTYTHHTIAEAGTAVARCCSLSQLQNAHGVVFNIFTPVHRRIIQVGSSVVAMLGVVPKTTKSKHDRKGTTSGSS